MNKIKHSKGQNDVNILTPLSRFNNFYKSLQYTSRAIPCIYKHMHFFIFLKCGFLCLYTYFLHVCF